MDHPFRLAIAFLTGVCVVVVCRIAIPESAPPRQHETTAGTNHRQSKTSRKIPSQKPSTSIGAELWNLSQGGTQSFAGLIELSPELGYLSGVEGLSASVIACPPPMFVDLDLDEETCLGLLESLAALPEWKDFSTRENFLKTTAWSDPELALSLSESIGPVWGTDSGDSWRRHVYHRWSLKDPKAALDAFQNSSDPRDGDESLVRSLTHRWALSDPVAFASAIEDGTAAQLDLNSHLGPDDIAGIAHSLADTDLRTSIASITASFGRGGVPYQILREVIGNSFAQDPAEMMRKEFWSDQGLDPNHYLPNLLGGRYRDLAVDDAAIELETIREQFGADVAANTLISITASLDDIASFQEWQKAYPDEIGDNTLMHFVNNNIGQIPIEDLMGLAGGAVGLEDGIIAASVYSLSSSDPAAAARMLADQRLTNSRPDVAIEISSHLVADDPLAAFTLLEANIDPANLVQTQKSLVTDWVAADPWAASQFVSDLPAGELRDHAAGQLVENVIAWDPEVAFIWAMQVTDSDARFEALANAPDEAFADTRILDALEGSNLSDNDKQRLLARFKNRPAYTRLISQ